MFIIAYGDLHDGFTFVGPFPNMQEATAYIESEDDKSLQWSIQPLWMPDLDANGLREYADEVHAFMTR